MSINERVAYRAGVRDWLVQRVTALVLIAFVAVMIIWLAMNQQVSYQNWSELFQHPVMRIFTIITMLCLCMHAWVGVWTVLTDYVKPFLLRMTLFVLVILALVAYLLWTIQILWGV